MCYKCRLRQRAQESWMPFPSAADVKALQMRSGLVGLDHTFPPDIYLANGLAGTVWSAAPSRDNPGMRWIL